MQPHTLNKTYPIPRVIATIAWWKHCNKKKTRKKNTKKQNLSC